MTAAAVRERPILFQGRLVRAILAGEKTVTRRPVKQPRRRDGVKLVLEVLQQFGVGHACPYGAPGERLWVRETWGLFDTQPADGPEGAEVFYRATDGERHELRHQLWRPSIFMPRWACRIVLEITHVHVERLTRITEGEALAEGIRAKGAYFDGASRGRGLPRSLLTARDAFIDSWNHLYRGQPERQSDADPWVWVVRFRRLTP